MRMAPLLSAGNKSSTQINERANAYNSMINIFSCWYGMVIYALDFYSFTLQKKIAFHSVWHSCVATLFVGDDFFTIHFYSMQQHNEYYTISLYSIRFEDPSVIAIADVALPFISLANFFSLGHCFFFVLLAQFSVFTMNISHTTHNVCFLDCSTAFFLSPIHITCSAAHLQYICICMSCVH